mgnify:CR=1 FL=1
MNIACVLLAYALMHTLLYLDSLFDIPVEQYFFFVGFVHCLIVIICCCVAMINKSLLLWGYAALNFVCCLLSLLMVDGWYHSLIKSFYYESAYSIVNITIAYEFTVVVTGIYNVILAVYARRVNGSRFSDSFKNLFASN